MAVLARTSVWLWAALLAALAADVRAFETEDPCKLPAAMNRARDLMIESGADVKEFDLEVKPLCVADDGDGLPMYLNIPIIFCLVALSGLFSGLTLGLMGLDVIGLETVVRSGEHGGDQYQAACAQKIIPIRERGNLLLCTLLLGNVAVNSALSILTAEIASGLVGFLVSTALIVVFGEILPQAACSRYALQVGAATVMLTKVLMFSPLFVLTKPLSMMLDCLLGKEVPNVLSGTELREMLKLQIKMGAVDANEGEEAQKIAEGAMCFRDKTVEEVMTPVNDAYFLPADTSLGFQTIKDIFEQGYSRVPVYKKERNDYIGMLHTKDLMFADPEDEMKLGEFIKIFGRKADTFWQEDKLPEVLRRFKSGGAHMGIVRKPIIDSDVNPTYEIVGVITLEDVMEEILQDEIIDEHDVYVDVDTRKLITGRAKRSEIPLGFFDPRYRKRHDTLAEEELTAVTRHLGRCTFGPGSGIYELSMPAVEWLVASSRIENRVRRTPMQFALPKEEDFLFCHGKVNDRCVLVLQGRLTALAGMERFRTEVGAFSVIGRDALASDTFYADFDAWLSTESVRILTIKKETFQKAQELDKDSEALASALAALNRGSLKRAPTSKSLFGTRNAGWVSGLACPPFGGRRSHSRGRRQKRTDGCVCGKETA